MYNIQIDNFIFYVNVTEYCPAIPGSYDKNAASDWDYFGIPMELEWGCNLVHEMGHAFNDIEIAYRIEGDDALEIVDAYAEQITEKLLEKLKFEQECAEECYA